MSVSVCLLLSVCLGVTVCLCVCVGRLLLSVCLCVSVGRLLSDHHCLDFCLWPRDTTRQCVEIVSLVEFVNVPYMH